MPKYYMIKTMNYKYTVSKTDNQLIINVTKFQNCIKPFNVSKTRFIDRGEIKKPTFSLQYLDVSDLSFSRLQEARFYHHVRKAYLTIINLYPEKNKFKLQQIC